MKTRQTQSKIQTPDQTIERLRKQIADLQRENVRSLRNNAQNYIVRIEALEDEVKALKALHKEYEEENLYLRRLLNYRRDKAA